MNQSSLNLADGSVYHIDRKDWLYAPNGEKRGYIVPNELKELWFHTGTICNLKCPFCLEGSKPGDDRLQKITFKDAKVYIDEALKLGVQKFSFTGGEPFVVKDIVEILDYALSYRNCLVLTNGTQPLTSRIKDLDSLREKENELSFRISLDYADPSKHDEGRGVGNFERALNSIYALEQKGFLVSVARQREENEDVQTVEDLYRQHFQKKGISPEIKFVSFPDFAKPGSIADVPHITEECMTTYHSKKSRDQFMCTFSKMIVKIDGQMKVFACTLVDDDLDYDLGSNLVESMKVRVNLKHHRCYSCFGSEASCSELN